MGIFRLYTDNDGQSHIEEQAVVSHPALTSPRATVDISFRELAVGTFMDWHNAPRRQYVIVLSGQIEVGLGDGTVRRFGPGDANLAEDITGQGHTTRVVGNEPVIAAIVPLAEAGS